MSQFKLNTVEEILQDVREGKLVIVVDDENRENEGDLIVAAEKITPEIVNFMVTHGKGLFCAPLPASRCQELNLDMMTSNNTAIYDTPFTISVDLLGNGCTTGISAGDRAKTTLALVDANLDPSTLGRPGHVFPLRAHDGGVLFRAGHTEAVVDLTRLAGLTPGGALVEILNEDGTMARLPELVEFAKKFDLKILSIKDLVAYRLKEEGVVEQGKRVKMPTIYGDFEAVAFREKDSSNEHIALIKGTWEEDEPVLVRMHSSCVTGDIFGSCRCDCGLQLKESIRMIEKEGKGIIVYLSQEGRGIGLFNKIHAYKLQDEGEDTVQANISLGFKEDERDYSSGASILLKLKAKNLRLITNNPAKRTGLELLGINIVEQVPIIIPTNPHNEFYMETKAKKMGHVLNDEQ